MKIPVKVYEEVNSIPSRSLYDSSRVRFSVEGRRWYRVTRWLEGRMTRYV